MTPVSNGWIVFVRLLGMIFPGATATMSISPQQLQPRARQNTVMIVAATARPIGEGGVSTISSAAGRKASSSRPRVGAIVDVMAAHSRAGPRQYGPAGGAARHSVLRS